MNSTKFDARLNEIQHYKNFPSLLPFVGENYGKDDLRKLLLVAESHYLPEYSTVSNNAEEWYKMSEKELDEEEIAWMNTREILNGDWTENGHMIYRELENRMSPYIKSYNGRSMNSCAFMNGFQRPSPETGGSIKHFSTEVDYIESAKVMVAVIEIIKPTLVIFVSKFTWDVLAWRIKKEIRDIELSFVCHPATGGRFWHNTNYHHGLQKFIKLISQQ